MKGNRKPSFWVILALALCLVSLVGASLVQTVGGRVAIKDLRWETPSGHLMSALLYVPNTATKDAPAPAIVASHGWYNNREMQDLNYVELARRGYVVISIDMYGHGNSDIVDSSEWSNRGTGMYDAVELLADLPYVDATRIGVTGHSNGARAANWAVDTDNLAENPLIASVLLVANDATYRNPETQEYWNKYGGRDVGIIAAQFDEFFFRSYETLEDGSRTIATYPKNYITTPNAQSFLNFGVDPAALEARNAGEMYTQAVEGEDAIRVIYTPYQTHPWNHFSATCVTQLLEFFDASLGTPNPIAADNQIWQWKAAFNGIGLVGFVMFLIYFALLLVEKPFFASLAAKEPAVAGPAPKGLGVIWFWGSLAVCAILGGFLYFGMYSLTSGGSSLLARPSGLFWAAPPYFIGMWSAVCGLLAILVMVVWYRAYGKKNGVSLAESGAAIGLKKLGKTVLLALTVVVCGYGIVFVGDYFFKADFRFWVLTVKAFTADKILVALPYLPLFLLYYIANAVSLNCFNYVKIGKKDWMNTAVLAIANCIGPVVICLMQYIHFYNSPSGAPMFKTSGIVTIWLYPVIVILATAAVVSRKIYRKTKNPYLAGIINATIVTLISVTNTLIQLP